MACTAKECEMMYAEKEAMKFAFEDYSRKSEFYKELYEMYNSLAGQYQKWE